VQWNTRNRPVPTRGILAARKVGVTYVHYAVRLSSPPFKSLPSEQRRISLYRLNAEVVVMAKV
jgi:hypothetical protein